MLVTEIPVLGPVVRGYSTLLMDILISAVVSLSTVFVIVRVLLETEQAIEDPVF